MENIKFKNLQDLYKRIRPAIHSKIKEMQISGYYFIKEEDIFNYLKETKWMNETNITLNDLVSDILNTPNEDFLDYYKKDGSRWENTLHMMTW